MTLNTRVLFTAFLQGADADCICDIGSRDGEDSLRFRNLFPTARILAFEANKFNFEKMQASPQLSDAKIELMPCAVSNADGEATFHITVPSQNDPGDISGTSSLLVTQGVEIRERVQVKTRRLDSILPEVYPNARNIGLWIDVEGAEFQVVQGLSGLTERVVALHVETSSREMGFEFAVTNFDEKTDWGDVVYINRAFRAKLGKNYERYLRKARASKVWRLGSIAGFLQNHIPWLYRLAYRYWHRTGVKRGG
jgi:FkbM family methyltransferase